MLKKTRTNIDACKLQLEECYEKGMTGLQSEDQKRMADELCSKTNLNRSQVKNWLSNRRKKIAGTAGRKKVKYSQRQKSGRDLFLKENMKGFQNSADKLSETAAKWLAIKDTPEGQEFARKAKLEAPTDVAMLDVEQTTAFIQQQFIKLNKLLSVMESGGMETMVLCYNSKTGTVQFAGTEKGTQFRNKRPDIFASFLAFVTDGAAVEVDVKAMRTKVLDLMDVRYCELTGVKKCNYEALKGGQVVLEGLPTGMTLHNPWTASKKKLSAILANQCQIKFRISSTSVSASPHVHLADVTDNGTATNLSVVLGTVVTPERISSTSVSASPHVHLADVTDNGTATNLSVVLETVVTPERNAQRRKTRKRNVELMTSGDNAAKVDCKIKRRLKNKMDQHDDGRLHSAVALFCDCESHPSTLLRYSFWAATPSYPNVGFSVHLLDTLHLLTLECAVSVKGFVQMLRWKNRWSEVEFHRLYTLLIGESISSYRTFTRNHEQQHLRYISGISNPMKCPACPKGCGVTTISIDGNFGLVRKRNSGVSTRGASTAESGFFLDDEVVESFVNSYQNDKQKDQECSTFKAGDAIRSGARNAKLDIRGVFGSVCRHEFPVMFMDMKHAERLAYPVCLIEELRKTLGDTQLQVVYDIGCVLTRHLKKTNQTSIIDNIQLGLPIFHAYGHGASCQVQYSVRGLDGFGLTDGEGTERLWSFLRPLAKMTKEMTPSHRKELLNDALNQFCRRKIAGLATWLDMRVTRAGDVQKEARKSLKEMTELLQVTDDQVRIWALEQKQQFATSKPLSISGISWETSYVTKLQCYYSLRSQIQSCAHNELAVEVQQKLSKLEVSLQKAELKQSLTRWNSDHPRYVDGVHTLAIASKTKILRQLHRDSSSWAFLVQLLSKYCDGQMIAIRLSKQVHKATVVVQKGVQLYNAVIGMKIGSCLHQTITEKEALIPSSAIFFGVLDDQQAESLSVPASQRWKAVEHLMLCTRASEELGRMTDDIRATVQHYCSMHNALWQAIQSVSSSSERTLLIKRALDMELIMQRIWQVARKHLVEVELMPSLSDLQNLNQPADTETVIDTMVAEAFTVDSDCEHDSDVDCY